MMNYVEWIFSGVGTSILAIAASGFFVWIRTLRRKAPSLRRNACNVGASVETYREVEPILPALTETEKIALRFNKILDLMNSNRKNCPYSIAALARKMGLSSVGELEKIFSGVQEPSFEMMESFCNQLGVHIEWLAEGKSQPYIGKRPSNLMPMEAFDRILSADPKEICFVRSESKAGRSTILLKHDNFKYERATRAWNISSEIGGTGERQLVSFYKLVCKLKRNNRIVLRGKIVDEPTFTSLMSGEIFLGSFFDCTVDESDWWDDLTDYSHKYRISDSYEKYYGEEFMKAQGILRSALGQPAL